MITHTIQGTIDNAMNITEAISMLTSVYKGCIKLNIECVVSPMYPHGSKTSYVFTLEYKEEL